MSCKCGDVTCNCQFVCCCQRDLCSCDLCSVARGNSCYICGLPLDIEGQDVCQCFLEIAAPNLSDAPQVSISPSHQVEPKVRDDSSARKDTLASEENFNVSEQRRVKNEQRFLSLDSNPPMISNSEETFATKRTQNPGVLVQEVPGETSINQCTANIEGQTQEISDTCLQGNQNKNTTHSSKSCNILLAFCASRNVTQDTTRVPEGETHSGLVTHTKYSLEHASEGNSTKTKNYEEKRPERTAGKSLDYGRQREINTTPNIPRKENTSTLSKQEQNTDQSRTFFSQKIPGLPFYRNEGFNFRIPCVRNWYAPKPFFNFPPTGFLDYSRFPQYSFPESYKSTERPVTEHSPPPSEITPAEKHAYIQDWIERSNPNAGNGQEQGIACSSLGTELNSNTVTPGRKIRGRFIPVSKKEASEESFIKRSSPNKELTPRGALFDDKTCTSKTSPGQEHSVTSSSWTKRELSSHIVPVGRKIEGRFSVGKKCTSEERFGKRSSAHTELSRSRGKDDENLTTLKLDEKMTSTLKLDEKITSTLKLDEKMSSTLKLDENITSTLKLDENITSTLKLDENITSTLKLDEKDSSSIEKSENTRPAEESLFSTGKETLTEDFPPLAAEINATESSCIGLSTMDYKQESSAQCDSKEKQC